MVPVGAAVTGVVPLPSIGSAVVVAAVVVSAVVVVAGGYVFNVVLQDGTPGAYLASFTALAQLPDLWQGMLKALVFGLIAAVVASYKGMNAAGGPKGANPPPRGDRQDPRAPADAAGRGHPRGRVHRA